MNKQLGTIATFVICFRVNFLPNREDAGANYYTTILPFNMVKVVYMTSCLATTTYIRHIVRIDQDSL